ncbi:hypothetical protein Godav_009609 [Gossypium davidsonii]|uniref:RNase H type-1 domain-containing protein n=1 Tax=Gossypium davidsonii TaxID=34287 RepID=A0A7J8SE79_GOSDV|nr:hypothetical protein [Gossypium davidsonii]
MTGIIFRDNERYILASCTYANNFVANATTAEARSCLQSMTVAEELGFQRLVVKLKVIKKARSIEEDRSSIDVIEVSSIVVVAAEEDRKSLR